MTSYGGGGGGGGGGEVVLGRGGGLRAIGGIFLYRGYISH